MEIFPYFVSTERIRHSLDVVSMVSVYAPIEVSDLTVKATFYATLESVVDQCPRRDILPVLGDFNASTGTDRDVMRHVLVPSILEL